MFQNVFITSRTDNSPSLVYLWDDEYGFQTLPYSEFYYAYRRDPNGKLVSLHGDKLTKVKRFDWEDPDLFESDVSRETRVLSDLYLHSDEVSTGHRVVFFDIEVRSNGGFATWMEPFQEVTAISMYSQEEDVYYIFLLDPEQKIESVHEGNKILLSCQTEIELLESFLETYRAVNPTILTGWNTDGYDIPYLYNRLLKVLGPHKANRLSPIDIVKYQQGREKYQIAGVSSLDYLALYKKFTYIQKPSYRLDAIGRDEVGMGKVEYEGTLDDLFHNDLPKFIKYNLTDVEIVVAIDKQKRLIDLVRRICHVGHVPYEDFMYNSKFIEGTILTYLHRKNIIAPNKPAGGREAFEQKLAEDSDGFEGAYVRPPFPDLYDWVFSLDLQSLYPSIIMSLNISSETKMGRVPGWDTEKHMRNQIPTYFVEIGNSSYKFQRAQFIDFLQKNQLTISSNGILYTTKTVGVIPSILDEWFKKRVEYKDLMKKYAKEGNKEKEVYYDQLQAVQKVFLNSIYGVLGLSIFRFYDLDNAAAVTVSGQDIIKTTAKYISGEYKKAGVAPKEQWWLDEYRKMLEEDEEPTNELNEDDHCLYIDTDSVYFSAVPLIQASGEPVVSPKEFTINLARTTEAKVNKLYDVLAKILFNCDTHRFYIKGESIMETAFWVKKKRYALKKIYDLEKNMDKDELVVKGMDVVRSSFPPAFQKFMKGILKDILDKKPKSGVDAKVLQFYKDIQTMPIVDIARNTSIKELSKYEDVKNNNLSWFPKGATAHAKACMTYNRLLRLWGKDKIHAPIKNGDKIKYVFLKEENPYRLESVAWKTYDDPEELMQLINEYVDHKHLFEAEMEKKLEKFYNALRWGLIPTKINQAASMFLD